MDTIQKARQVILDAEVSLRDLIAKALAEQRYADVREIAELADGVTQLLQSSNIKLSISPTAKLSEPKIQHRVVRTRSKNQSAAINSSKRVSTTSTRASSAKKGYPKFVRDEDRLVKVGWSKKNKTEYEHRVPREAVLAFARHLDSKIEEAKVFEIDGLFPVTDGPDAEVPGYQVYVIVAWLREIGVIEKKGRDGYLIRDKSVLRGDLDEKWNSLQPRSA